MGRQAAGRRVTQDLDAVDDSGCPILHVDMDAFFAAVELRRRPELAGRPMMVAGTGGRGVVLSATYEARDYGIHSAMPTSRALARCPGVVVVPPDHGAYHEASSAVMSLFRQFTPIVEPLSVDEAFLDVRGAGRTGGRPGHIAATIRQRVRAELGLTATVGVASTKFVAKLASSLAKPDGVLVVPPAEVVGMLRPLPVGALWGVGPQTAERLSSLGLSTVGELADADPAKLGRAVGSVLARRLHDLSWGRDERSVTSSTAEASMGAEQTFPVDVTDPAAIHRVLMQLARSAAHRVRRAGLAGRTVVVKVRFDDFTTVTRSAALDAPADQDRDVLAAALRCWRRLGSGRRPVRLLGVRLEGLVRADGVYQQLELDTAPDRPGWRVAQRTLDTLTDRFGAVAPRPATLLARAASPPTTRRRPGSPDSTVQ